MPESGVYQERRFECWGQTLAGWFKPGDGEPILALHGWMDNANSFLPLAEHLANPILALDFSGHGFSEPRPGQTLSHFIDHVRDVVAVADDMNWERFILMGHSMGSSIASIFAGTFPDRISKLILLDGLGPWTAKSEDAPKVLRDAIQKMQKHDESKRTVYVDAQAAVKARADGFFKLSETSAQLLCDRGMAQINEGWIWRADGRVRLPSSQRMSEDHVKAFLNAITAPVLLVAAIPGLEMAKMVAHRREWVTSLEYREVEGTHHMHMDEADQVAEQINQFLNRS